MHLPKPLAAAIVAVAAVFAALPARAAGPADDLYLMVRYVYGGGSEIDAFLFRQGQVVRGPSGSIDRFDFAAARANSPSRVGSYALRGDRMAVTWADGHVADGQYEQKPNDPCFWWDTGSFCPITPFARGQRLSGTFAGGTDAYTVTGAKLSRDMELTLAADGRYALTGQAAILPGSMGPNRPSMPGAAAAGTETGTYEIDGTALALRPAAGTARVAMVFPYDDGTAGPAPRRLYFDGALLTHRN